MRWQGVLSVGFLASIVFAAQDARLGTPATVPDNPRNPTSDAKVALGKKLFEDKILSGSNSVSCATCHDPKHGFGDPNRRSEGDAKPRLTKRHSPALLTTGYLRSYFWDGRSRSLEDQALEPIANPDEMNQHYCELIEELAKAGYEPAFRSAFGGEEPLSILNVANALAAFQRTLTHNDTPYDRWIAGEDEAMSAAAKRGFAVFSGKANCVSCHYGPNFTKAAGPHGASRERTGVPMVAGDDPDFGPFKVPTLRGVGLSAPYMHNGSLATLEDVVEFYNTKSSLPELNLTDAEKADLVSFLREGITRRP